jgi:hypothetical protein
MNDLTKSDNPQALIQAAIEHNLDAERLGKLLDLQERYEKNKAYAAYAEAMAECEKEMPVVLKDRQNTHLKSRYATLDAVNTAIKPIYAKHGFSVSFSEEPTTTANVICVVATIRHRGGHSETYRTTVPIDGGGMKGGTNKTDTQAKGSTLTYARRYLILMIFNIAIGDEDTDGAADPPKKLSEYELKTLVDMIDAIEKSGKPFSFNKFLAACHVPETGALTDILPANYSLAVAMLGRKLAAEDNRENV